MFKPDAPLRPDTLYRASARVRAFPRDVRSEPITLSFRTGSGPLPALVSATQPSISLEWYDAPFLRCDGGELEGDAARDALTPQICPVHFESNCKEAGTRRRLRYRVRTGAISGGDTRLPYVVEAILTDVSHGKFDSPPRINAPSEGPDPAEHTTWSHRESEVELGESGDLYFDAPSGDSDPDQLCVRMRVVDAAGHVLAPPGRCDSRAQRLAEVGEDPEGTSGCSLRARAARDASLELSLLALAGALGIRRRRRT